MLKGNEGYRIEGNNFYARVRGGFKIEKQSQEYMHVTRGEYKDEGKMKSNEKKINNKQKYLENSIVATHDYFEDLTERG